MKWRKVSPELSAFLAESIRPFPCQNKPMFGCPAYFANDNMFAGVHQESMIMRLSEPDRRQFMATYDEAALFEPMPGRPMKEYVVVPEALQADMAAFTSWLERAHRYALSLPAKERQQRKAGKPGKAG